MSAKTRPKKLYKYRSLAKDNFRYTMEIFTHNLVKFTKPIDFNDPFESRFEICFDASYEEQYEFIKNVITNSSYEQAFKDSQLLSLKRETVAETIHEMTKQYKGEISDSIRRKKLVFSLSESYDEIVMWSHYADNNRGICIEFDTEALAFEPITFLEYVEYRNTFPRVYPIKSGGKLTAEITAKILLRKFERWKYEAEWRYVVQNDGLELRPFPSNAITGVILGHNISPGDRDNVRKCVKGRNISVTQARTREDDYKLEFKFLPEDAIYESHETAWNCLC